MEGGREGEWKTGIRSSSSTPAIYATAKEGGGHVCVLSVRPPSPAFVCARGGECIRTTATTRCRPWSGRRGGRRSLLQQLQVGSVRSVAVAQLVSNWDFFCLAGRRRRLSPPLILQLGAGPVGGRTAPSLIFSEGYLSRLPNEITHQGENPCFLPEGL